MQKYIYIRARVCWDPWKWAWFASPPCGATAINLVYSFTALSCCIHQLTQFTTSLLAYFGYSTQHLYVKWSRGPAGSQGWQRTRKKGKARREVMPSSPSFAIAEDLKKSPRDHQLLPYSPPTFLPLSLSSFFRGERGLTERKREREFSCATASSLLA